MALFLYDDYENCVSRGAGRVQRGRIAAGQRRRDARAVQELRRRVRDRRAGAGVVRRAADRELDRREHPPQLRPADGEPPADRRRSGSARRPSSARVAGRRTPDDQARLFTSPGPGAVRAVPADVVRRGDHRDVRHGGERQDGVGREAHRHRGDRVGPRRATFSACRRSPPPFRTSATTSRGSS